MNTMRREKRGRKVFIGPFDTFVKQLQNVATLFPGMSEAEQYQAVNILKQFTSVIAERFGSDEPPADIEYINDVKPVEIIPLSPGIEETVIDEIGPENNVNSGGSPVDHAVKSESSGQVKHLQNGVQDSPDLDSEYYHLTVAASDGSERVVLIKRDDVALDNEGNIIINREEIKALLDEFTGGGSRTKNETTVLNSGKSFNDEVQSLDDGDRISDASNIPCSTEKGKCKDTVNLSEQSESQKEMTSDEVQSSCEDDREASVVNSVSRQTKCTEMTTQSAVNMSETNNASPELSEKVPIKRKRGRPKGSRWASKSREKTVCSVCGKQLNNKSNLTVHMRSHTGERPYKCQYCDDAFTTHGNLRRHKAAHLGEKKYMCHICKRAFLEKKSMVMHMRRHTGEKPYSCEFCGQTFRQSSALRIHRAKHTGIRNHVCSLCNKSFIQRGALILHMKQHSEGKTISCPDCSRLFHNREQLARHQQRHSKGVTFRCVLCSVTLSSQNSLLTHMTTFHGEGGERKFVCRPCNEEYLNKNDLQEHVKSLPHLQTVRLMEDGSSVTELFQADIHLEELSKGDLEDLSTVKQEDLFDGEVNKTNRDVYPVDNPEGGIKVAQVLSQESLPGVVVNSLDNVILTDKGNRIYLLKNVPDKTVGDEQIQIQH